MSDELNCPFCAGADIRFNLHRGAGDVWSTCCYDCGAIFPNRYKKELLIECWKRRPAPDKSAKPIGYVWMHEMAQRSEHVPARIYLTAADEYTVPVYAQHGAQPNAEKGVKL